MADRLLRNVYTNLGFSILFAFNFQVKSRTGDTQQTDGRIVN